MEELPRELEEAIFVDGGTPLTAFRHVVLPLAQPALATVAVFTFLFSWDEFTWALTSLNRQELRTLPIAIAIPFVSNVVRGAVAATVGTLGSALVTPILYLSVVLLYFDLRIRKESFDLDQLASQVPGGSQP